jgi:tryptophanyl-tRNA synthetase
MKCASHISEMLQPIIEKRNYFEGRISEVENILHDGETRGRATAQATMNEVRDKMKLG